MSTTSYILGSISGFALGILLIFLIIPRKVDSPVEKVIPPSSGWKVTENLTPYSSVPNNEGYSLSTRIITDPLGQKFLIVRFASGVAITPYKESQSTLEKSKE
jgi:hypothetical protein